MASPRGPTPFSRMLTASAAEKLGKPASAGAFSAQLSVRVDGRDPDRRALKPSASIKLTLRIPRRVALSALGHLFD